MSKVKEIIAALDFAELVSKRTTLKRVKQNEYRGLSPFTNEKTPSFFLNNTSKTWWCFSSGFGGGALDYVERSEGLDRSGAVAFLAEFCGIEIEQDPEFSKFKKILKFAQDFYTKGKSKAIQYMVARGFSEDVVDKYGLGFSGNEEGLFGEIVEQGFTLEDGVAAGLLYERDGSIKARFINRLMIPIKDPYGQIIAFTGRDLSGKSSAKYLHGPTTKLFRKKEVLWNLNNIRAEASNLEKVVVCEGQMDAIALSESGIPAVASLGSSISEEQLSSLSKISQNIYIVYDSDAAGEKGLVRAFKLSQELGLDSITYSVVLPGKDDPDTFIHQYGPEEFEKHIKDSQSDTTAIVKALIRENYSEKSTKASIAKSVLADLKTSFKQAFTYRSLDLMERVAQEFSLNPKELRTWLQDSPSFKGGGAVNDKINAMSFPAPIYERRILLSVLNEPHLISKVREKVGLDDFESHLVHRILSHAKTGYSSAEYFDILREELTEDEYYQVLEFFSIGLSDIEFDNALDVLQNKVLYREKNAKKPFLGRPIKPNEGELRSVFRDILEYK